MVSMVHNHLLFIKTIDNMPKNIPINSKRVTIKDLAKELNTTTSTVSRALHGHGTISEGMKSKVMELAKKGISLSIGMLQTYDPDLVKQLESLCHVSIETFSQTVLPVLKR